MTYTVAQNTAGYKKNTLHEAFLHIKKYPQFSALVLEAQAAGSRALILLPFSRFQIRNSCNDVKLSLKRKKSARRG